jgi:hypothetical protein
MSSVEETHGTKEAREAYLRNHGVTETAYHSDSGISSCPT